MNWREERNLWYRSCNSRGSVLLLGIISDNWMIHLIFHSSFTVSVTLFVVFYHTRMKCCYDLLLASVTRFWWCQSRIKQGCFNKHSKVKYCFKINSRSSKQRSRFIQDQLLPQNTLFPTCQGYGNRLPGSVIDYQKTSLQISFLKGFEIWILKVVIDYHWCVIDYQQCNSWNSIWKVMTLQNIIV